MLQAYVFKRLRCLRGMLQVFHMDIAKVDRDIAYVAMAIHVCCKCLSQMFYLFYHTILQVCLLGCCIYFTNML
jgi:hypothetical protein